MPGGQANEIFGVDLTLEDFYASDPWGKTDVLITREMLAKKGVSAIEEIQLHAWSHRACEIFAPNQKRIYHCFRQLKKPSQYCNNKGTP
jgi:hypothetical protein